MAKTGSQAENHAPDRDRVPALGGRLSAISLFDLCQFLMLNRKTGNLTVRSGSGTVYLVFMDGQLLTASDDLHRDGEDVVLRAVQWEDGTFEYAPGPVPPNRRIQASTENILLEAARRIDEMRAEEGDGVQVASSAEIAFREKQSRANSLVEAFRSAVTDADLTHSESGWRGRIVAKMGLPSCERLVLGPGSRIGLVMNGRYEGIKGVSDQEVRAWMDDLAPQTIGREARRAFSPPRSSPQPDGSILWALRVTGPTGEWVAATLARSQFPEWPGFGLTDDEVAPLDRMRAGLVVATGELPSDCESPIRTALPAWLRRRAARDESCGIVIEDLPRFDWSALPGCWRFFPASWAGRGDRLESLLRTTGARSLVWFGNCPGRVLAEAIQLADSGFFIVLAEEARGIDEWSARTTKRLALLNLSWRPSDEALGFSWHLRRGPVPTGLPLQSRIVPLDRTVRPI